MKTSKNLGCIALNDFCYRNIQMSPLKNMVIMDELLDQWGNEFQNTSAKHERRWTFEEYIREILGVKIMYSAMWKYKNDL